MKKLAGTMAALAVLTISASAFAADVTVFIAAGSVFNDPVGAETLGSAPVIPQSAWDANLDGIPDANIPIQIWIALNNQGANYSGTAYHYQTSSGGGFDLAGDNDDVKGSGMNLFRTFNTAASARRWDSASATGNGAVGGAGYAWQGTLWDQGIRSGASTNPAATGPAVVDVPTKYFLIMEGFLDVNGAGMTNPTGTGDGFFDVFFELANGDFGAGPISPVADVSWGWDGPKFFGSNAVSGGFRSPVPNLRIAIPEPATMGLLALGGLFLRRRR